MKKYGHNKDLKKYNHKKEKSSLNLKPFGVLGFSMAIALVALLLFKDNKPFVSSPSASPEALLATKTQALSSAKTRKRQFTDNFVILNSNEDKSKPSAKSSKKASTSGSSSSSNSAEIARQLDSQLESAQDLVDTGEMDSIMKAKEILEKVLAADPKHDGSLKELAMIHLYDLDEPVKAQEYLERSYDLYPEDSLVFSETLQLAVENGNLEQFSNKVREKSESNPENMALANQAAWAVARGNDPVRAANAFGRVYESFGSSDAALSEAIYWAKAKDPGASRSAAQKALSAVDSDPNLSQDEKKRKVEDIKRHMSTLPL